MLRIGILATVVLATTFAAQEPVPKGIAGYELVVAKKRVTGAV
jgi:hypothetical protein